MLNATLYANAIVIIGQNLQHIVLMPFPATRFPLPLPHHMNMQVPVEVREKSRRDTSRRVGLGIWRLRNDYDTRIEQENLQLRNGNFTHHRLALL
jgi:hypothetical protein